MSSMNRIPLTFISAIRKFYVDYNLISIMAWPNRDDNDDTRKKYEKDKETNREITENHELIMALSKIVESAFESGFQFFFQSVFKLPSLLLSITSHRAGSSWKDLVNWATVSIAASFVSFAWTYSTIRYAIILKRKVISYCFYKFLLQEAGQEGGIDVQSLWSVGVESYIRLCVKSRPILIMALCYKPRSV